MKAKSIFQCAALLTGLLFLNVPLFAAVESDIVGYTTITLEAGKWYMIGTPFESLTKGEAIKINKDLVTGFSAGDILQVYSPAEGRYSVYKFKDGLSGEQTAGWCKTFGSSLQDITLQPGEAVFINKLTTSDVVVAGRVNLSAQYEFGDETTSVWNLLVSPTLQKTKLNDLNWVGVSANDILQIYNPTTGLYTVYKYKTGLSGEKTAGWCKTFGSTPVDVDVDPGAAFFVNKATPGKATVGFSAN